MNTAVFISAVSSLAVLGIGGFTVIAQVLGQRITDMGSRIDDLGGRVNNFESRFETRMLAQEGAIRDIGQRLTVLETDLGKH